MTTTRTTTPVGFAAGAERPGLATQDVAELAERQAANGGAYLLPNGTGTTIPAMTWDGEPIVCTLNGDGGNMAERLGEWQALLAQATGREAIDEGLAVTFDHDIARTAELGPAAGGRVLLLLVRQLPPDHRRPRRPDGDPHPTRGS